MAMRLVALVVGCALLLTGCASTPPPVSAAQRAHIRTALLDQQWAPLAQSYPEAFRPAVPVTHTVTDHDWPTTVAACLRGRGYEAFAARGGYQYSAKSNETSLEFAIDGYICTASFVQESAVLARLSDLQQRTFDDFQVEQVQPCLRLAGVVSSGAPTQHLTGLAGWSPFDSVWSSNPSGSAISYLEQRCPPIPGWLDLSH
jgi:hypothetical protein